MHLNDLLLLMIEYDFLFLFLLNIYEMFFLFHDDPPRHRRLKYHLYLTQYYLRWKCLYWNDTDLK